MGEKPVDVVEANRFGRSRASELPGEGIEVSRVGLERVRGEGPLDAKMVEVDVNPALKVHGTA